jgi:hypothetical protein
MVTLISNTSSTLQSLTVIALQETYPELNWSQLSSTAGYWNKKEHQRKFFQDIAAELNVHKPQDWQAVNLEQVLAKGGNFVNTKYNGSLKTGMLSCDHFVLIIIALESVFPELKPTTKIKPELVSQEPKQRTAHWRDKEQQRKFFDELAVKLNIKKPEDWYAVSNATVTENGGWFLNYYYNGSLLRGLSSNHHCLIYFKALNEIYPSYQLKRYHRITFLQKNRGKLVSKAQNSLCDKVAELFPQFQIEQNLHWVRYRTSTTKLKLMEFDVSFVT